MEAEFPPRYVFFRNINIPGLLPKSKQHPRLQCVVLCGLIPACECDTRYVRTDMQPDCYSDRVAELVRSLAAARTL